MDENLQRLVRDLRKERCPASVLENVSRRISAERPASGRFRYVNAGAITALVLLSIAVIWQWQINREDRTPAPLAAATEINRSKTAEEAGTALAYIGQILLEASGRSKDVILKDAVPPLRNSFEIAKTKLMNPI